MPVLVQLLWPETAPRIWLLCSGRACHLAWQACPNTCYALPSHACSYGQHVPRRGDQHAQAQVSGCHAPWSDWVLRWTVAAGLLRAAGAVCKLCRLQQET